MDFFFLFFTGNYNAQTKCLPLNDIGVSWGHFLSSKRLVSLSLEHCLAVRATPRARAANFLGTLPTLYPHCQNAWLS